MPANRRLQTDANQNRSRDLLVKDRNARLWTRAVCDFTMLLCLKVSVVAIETQVGMDLKLLEDFLSLVQTQNFSRSAEERNVTQPAFSRRIQQLEMWVGVPLFDRSSYPTKLTRAGESFRDVAEDTLRALYAARDELRSEQRLDQDTISFATQHSISLWVFPRWMSVIQSKRGDITTRVIAGNMHDCVQLLVAGNCDFLICYHHPSVPLILDPERYPYHVLGHDALIAVSAAGADGTPRYRLPGAKSNPVPFLTYSSDFYFGRVVDWKLKTLSSGCFLRRVYENSMAESLKTMTIEGHGVAWLPHSTAEEALADKRLVRAGDGSFDVRLEVRIYRSLETSNNRIHDVWSILSEARDETI